MADKMKGENDPFADALPPNMTKEQMQKMMEQMQAKENEGLTPEEIEKKNKEKQMKKKKNIDTTKETMDVCARGSYEKDGKTVELGLSKEQMKQARVFLPKEVQGIRTECRAGGAGTAHGVFSCQNKDAITLASESVEALSAGGESGNRKVLLLNLANAMRPGGGTRDGFGGQEEALCRASTLLVSLESKEAKTYYEHNKALHTQLGSDAVILSPEVAVFRDEKGEFLSRPFTLSVITCAAPNVRFGFEGKTQAEYEEMLYGRIEGMLSVAKKNGYTDIILGAFGCGAFKNDAALVSDCFYRALTGPVGGNFARADFAVLCTEGKEYNYNEFCRNFAGNAAK